MKSPDPIIQVNGLGTRFGDIWVHRDLNLTVFRGEIIALVGSSGCGKTMLMREITMLQRPSAGTVRILGEDVGGLDPRNARALRRRLGFMFQRGALFTGMTVMENVSFPLREHARLNSSLISEVAMLKIRMAGLPADAAHKYPNELSGGMTKRAALARALALDPDMLFLDEPTAGLDPVGAAAFDDLVLELKALLGLTVVMVTHDLDSLWRATDRVAFLGQRRILGIAPVVELAESKEPEISAYFSGARMQRARERSWKHE